MFMFVLPKPSYILLPWMFVSVRDQGRQRRSQTYGVSKAARSSKLSLLSAISTQSHGSNDSASTITQESYTRSISGSGKRRRTSKQRKARESREGKGSLVMKSSSEKAIKEKSMSRESVDVFAFLVQEEQQDTPKVQPEEPSHVQKGDTPALEESDSESVVRSQHSDSGISMGDSSISHLSNEAPLDNRLPPLLEDSQEANLSHSHDQSRDRPNNSRRLRWKWPDIPPATHKHHIPNVRTPSPEQARVHLPHTPDNLKREFCLPQKALSGYDLVAHQLAHGELPPVFRQFKQVNFRILLQLQDEIIEMEEDMAALDLADTRSRLNSDGSASPASRRINWQWSQSDLQAYRSHVLGRLYIKLEQYCKPYKAMLVPKEADQ